MRMNPWTGGLAALIFMAGASAQAGEGGYKQDPQTQQEKQAGKDKRSVLEREDIKLDELSSGQVEHLQRQLKMRGIYDGEVTGEMNAATRQAWNDFRTQEGMEPSDRIDRETAEVLRFTVITVQPVRGTEPEATGNREMQSGGKQKAPKAAMEKKELTFEVLGVDRENQMVYFTRKDLGELGVQRGEGEEVDPEIWLQSGRDFAMSFQQLERAVEGNKSGSEIAQELHEGENVRVHTDDKGRVIHLEY